MQAQTSVSLAQIGGLILLLMILAVLFLGVALLLTRKRKPAARRPAERQTAATPARPAPAPTRAAAQPTPARNASAPLPANAAEVLRLYRDADGALTILLDGRSYRSLAEIKAAGLDGRFMTLLRELGRFTRASAPAEHQPSPGPEPAPIPEPEAEPLQPPAPASTAATLPTDAQPTLEELTGLPSVSPVAPGPGEPEPLGTFFDNMRRMVQPGARGDRAAYQPPSSIPDQIESILQLRLLTSDAYRGRQIHIKPAASGGVQIVVDQRVYEAVSDIEDTGVREFVQAAIRDWENQQG